MVKIPARFPVRVRREIPGLHKLALQPVIDYTILILPRQNNSLRLIRQTADLK